MICIGRAMRKVELHRKFTALHCVSDEWQYANLNAKYGFQFHQRLVHSALERRQEEREYCATRCRSMLKPDFCHSLCDPGRAYASYWYRQHYNRRGGCDEGR